MEEPVLQLEGVKTHFFTSAGVAKAVDGVDLHIDQGETLALVGESGCGKTMVSLSVMGLVPQPGKIVDGSIRFMGRELVGLPEKELRTVRGNRISMIFQEPMTSLNPVFTVGEQVGEALRLHRGMNKLEARKEAIELLSLVGIPDPANRVDNFPHAMSGGMRQRVVIAMALACGPQLLLADEPTTALDVTIQAQILRLMTDLRNQTGMGVLFITHDLGVVARHCERAAIMYSGRIVERATVRELFKEALHPYTQGLVSSLPGPGRRAGNLTPVTGVVPALTNRPSGCHFHPRCPRCFERCTQEDPPEFRMSATRGVRCWLYA